MQPNNHETAAASSAAPAASLVPPRPPHRRSYLVVALAHTCLAVVAALEPVPLVAASETLIAVTYLYLASRPGA